jgi:hypothetical protein
MYKILHLMLFHMKGKIYKMGYRPKPGSIYYSPSLSLIYYLRDTDINYALGSGIRRYQNK